MNPEQHREMLEESGEVLKNNRSDGPSKSQDDQNEQATAWDSLKDVPFRGDLEREAEEDEMEMGM